MKKNLLIAFILMAQSFYAQIVSYDNSFASNGKFVITAANNSYRSRIIQNADGSVYLTYAKDDASQGSPIYVLSKLHPNGAVDTSFGNNGETMINNYFAGIDSQLTKQTDGKLLIYGFNTEGAVIFRFLPNGQPDITFGVNGICKITNVFTDFYSYGYGLYLQNNKIIIYGMSTDGPSNFYKSVYRLNTDGSIDTAFGNNGSISTMGNFIFLDNQSNIISLISDYSHTNANVTYPNGGLEKYNSDGQPLTSFGNNGSLAFTTSPGNIKSAFMDSNNNIICSNNINNEIFRLNPNGGYDNTFTFNNNSYPFSIISLSAIVEKSGSYYISGQTGSTGDTFFISKLSYTGAVDPVFNYYSEATFPSLPVIDDLIINNNTILAGRGGSNILKFLLNQSTLSISARVESNTFIFENPVHQNIIFTGKNKPSMIEIYTTDGKLVKTTQENNSDVSDLPAGIYFAKAIFENGKTVLKKLVKN